MSLHVIGNKLVVGLNGQIQVRSLETWETERTLEGHTDWVRSLAAIGGKLVSSSSDNTIKVWA